MARVNPRGQSRRKLHGTAPGGIRATQRLIEFDVAGLKSPWGEVWGDVPEGRFGRCRVGDDPPANRAEQIEDRPPFEPNFARMLRLVPPMGHRTSLCVESPRLAGLVTGRREAYHRRSGPWPAERRSSAPDRPFRKRLKGASPLLSLSSYESPVAASRLSDAVGGRGIPPAMRGGE